jgi:hypothetical protein
VASLGSFGGIAQHQLSFKISIRSRTRRAKSSLKKNFLSTCANAPPVLSYRVLIVFRGGRDFFSLRICLFFLQLLETVNRKSLAFWGRATGDFVTFMPLL